MKKQYQESVRRNDKDSSEDQSVWIFKAKQKSAQRWNALETVTFDKRLPAGAVRLYFALFFHRNNNTNQTFVGQDTLMKELGCAKASLTADPGKRKRRGEPWLYLLVKYGYVELGKRQGTRSNLYTLPHLFCSQSKPESIDEVYELADKIDARDGTAEAFYDYGEKREWMGCRDWKKAFRGFAEKYAKQPKAKDGWRKQTLHNLPTSGDNDED